MKYIMLLVLLVTGCTTTKYVPVETIKEKYINTYSVDTLIMKDSIFIKEKNDTIYLEQYKYLYKNVYKSDTVLIKDTVPVIKEVEVPIEVEKVKIVNELKTWQIVLIILGGVLLGIIVYKILRIVKP